MGLPAESQHEEASRSPAAKKMEKRLADDEAATSSPGRTEDRETSRCERPSSKAEKNRENCTTSLPVDSQHEEASGSRAKEVEGDEAATSSPGQSEDRERELFRVIYTSRV